MIVEVAGIDDAEDILSLQRLAYVSEAEVYNDFSIPPLTQTLEEMESDFKDHVFLKATADGKIIGSVRALEKDGTCHVGRLIVHPANQNRGIGTKLLTDIEDAFKACHRFELFTGHRSKKNIRLYEKLGYRAFKAEKVSDNLIFIFFEKYTG